ncbi:MAG: hypothetical protein Q8O56_13115 [Solirubrobacteraceae bacterium]|nr:hypothetical protein [Solirubrobacteraceae bacterium]
MSDSRTSGVLLGAAIVVAALFAPWYAIELSGAARDTITQQSGQLPGVVGEFARGLLSILPERIVVNGWEAFEKTDVVLLGCALAAGFAAALGRLDVAALAGGGAALATVVAMLDKPGPGGDLIALQWGPWVALAGAAVILAGACLGARPGARGHPVPPPAPPLGDRPTVWPPV